MYYGDPNGDYLMYVFISDKVLKKDIDEYEKLTNMISKMTDEEWQNYTSTNKEYLFVNKDAFVKKRRALLREIFSNFSLWKQDSNRFSFQVLLNMADVSLKEKEKALKLYREQQAERLKRQQEWEKQEEKRRKKAVKKAEAERLKSQLENEKEEYISQLNKKYDSELIKIIKNCESIVSLHNYKKFILEAMDENKKRLRDNYINRLKMLDITEENYPELFRIADLSTLKKEASEIVAEKLVNTFGGIMGFDVPEYIDEYVYVSSIDKRLYADTQTKYKKAFDLIDVNLTICYGSTIDQKIDWLKKNQKDIIKYVYFRIFKKYVNLFDDVIFPIRYIKPTVYKAHGIKSLDTVELNIIFELKQPKRKEENNG